MGIRNRGRALELTLFNGFGGRLDGHPKYAVVTAVQLPSVSDVEFESSLAELGDLAALAAQKSALARRLHSYCRQARTHHHSL